MGASKSYQHSLVTA